MSQIGTGRLKLEINGHMRCAEVSVAEVRSRLADQPRAICRPPERDYVLALTLAQDAAGSSLWTEIFDHAGEDVPLVLMPYGNTTPTLDEPHFEQVATITEPDGALIGGGADTSRSARFTVETEWPLAGRPLKVTA